MYVLEVGLFILHIYILYILFLVFSFVNNKRKQQAEIGEQVIEEQQSNSQNLTRCSVWCREGFGCQGPPSKEGK